MIGGSHRGRPPGANGDWLRFARIALEWNHPRRDLDPESWVQSVAKSAQDAGVDTIAFDMYHGGYAVFNGAVAPKDDHVGEADLLDLMSGATRARNMRFVLMGMASHCANYAAEEHPSWRVVNQTGEPELGWPAPFMCLNSPYANYMLQELEGVLSRYRFDAFYLEGLYGKRCYCAYCQAEFRERHGRALPAASELAAARDLTHEEFVGAAATNLIRRIRGVIDAVSPDTAFVASSSWFEGSFADYASWGPYADAISLERQWGFGRFEVPLIEIGMSMQVVKAVGAKPASGTLWSAWNVDRNYAPCPAPHYRLNFMEILLYGATPQLHVQTLFEVDQSEISTVREMYDFETVLRPYLVSAELIPYAALVVDWTGQELSEHFKGYYQALIEAHIPFEVVSRHRLATDDLSAFRAIILPNIVRLSDGAIEALQKFQAGGGGLVMTYRTAMEHDDGSVRSVWPLAETAGIKGPFGIVSNPQTHDGREVTQGAGFELLPHTYYKITSDLGIDEARANRLQSFHGSYVEVESPTTMQFAQAYDFDYSKMHRRHPLLGWYPGRPLGPLGVVNVAGGTCVYFPGEFDRAARRDGMPGQLRALADAVRVAAGVDPPIEVTCGPTVEVASHRIADRSLAILLLNQTTNQLAPGWVVRHVQPVRNVGLSVELQSAPASVRSIRGSKMSWSHSGQRLTIDMEELVDYDAVVIEFGSKAQAKKTVKRRPSQRDRQNDARELRPRPR